MPIRNEARRVKTGNSLSNYESQINNCFQQLDTIRGQLVQLKTDMGADPVFNPSDEADVDISIALIDSRLNPPA